jgi:colanic acid biosynthesis glycosyl transferase WcaI
MRILLINQCFYPDVVSTAQYLADLALELAKSGHQVTVLAGRRGYDDPGLSFIKKEVWKGILVIRIPSTGLGKDSRFHRAVDFGTFTICCLARMLTLPRYDAVVALTSPPLISFLAALIAYVKRQRFYYWIMDLNPDEAIAAGWLRKDSLIEKICKALLAFSTRTARRLIVLDRFMKQRLLAKGVAEEKMSIIPPWSHDEHVFRTAEGSAAFRAAHGLTDKFVVMYAGNHSPCHPLDTLLQAALRLEHHSGIRFIFVGGGSEFRKAKSFVQQKALGNVDFLPYQPLNRLAAVLSSADLHVVVMGDSFAGIVHPCKIYNILSIGSPFLYIGPEESHIGDIIKRLGEGGFYSARNGDVESVAARILEAQKQIDSGERSALRELGKQYSGANLLPKMIEALECSPQPLIKPGIVWDNMGLGFPK